MGGWIHLLVGALVSFCSLQLCAAYAPGDVVPMLRSGQYHNHRSEWQDQPGRHCPRFGIDSEVVLPVPKPVGYTGSDVVKLALQFGTENFSTPWLPVYGRKSPNVAMIDVTLKHTGGDLVGVTAKVGDVPEKYLNEHPDARMDFWDPNRWPKRLLVHYVWEDQSEIDVMGINPKSMWTVASSYFLVLVKRFLPHLPVHPRTTDGTLGSSVHRKFSGKSQSDQRPQLHPLMQRTAQLDTDFTTIEWMREYTRSGHSGFSKPDPAQRRTRPELGRNSTRPRLRCCTNSSWARCQVIRLSNLLNRLVWTFFPSFYVPIIF